MICPECGHRVDDADYWWNDCCLRCALEREELSSQNDKE